MCFKTTRNTRKRAYAAEATLMAASKKKGLYAEGGHQHSQELSTSSVPPMKVYIQSAHSSLLVFINICYHLTGLLQTRDSRHP